MTYRINFVSLRDRIERIKHDLFALQNELDRAERAIEIQEENELIEDAERQEREIQEIQDRQEIQALLVRTNAFR